MPRSHAVETRCSRGRSLVVVGAIGTILGLTLRIAEVAAAGLALLAAPLIVRETLRYAIRRVAVSHEAVRSASEGDRVSITIKVENRSRVPLFFARVSEVFGPEALAPRTVEIASRIDPGRTAEETGFAICRRPRGIYVHGPLVVASSDPFDWFTVQRTIDVVDEVKVYPRLRNSVLPERIFASVSRLEYLRHALRVAEPDEFFAVRDWQPGDSLKRIHWPLTARRDFPVVREFLPAVQHDLAIFLDVSRQLRFGGARLSNFEDSIRFAASLAARAVRSGYGVQLRCGSSGSFDVPPSTGRGQYLRIVETLVRVRTRADDAYPEALRRSAGKMPPGATAVVVLHPYLLGNAAFASAVARLRKRGLRVACVVYHVRSDLVGPAARRRHSRFLSDLAAGGVELWTDRGMPLPPGQVPVSQVMS